MEKQASLSNTVIHSLIFVIEIIRLYFSFGSVIFALNCCNPAVV